MNGEGGLLRAVGLSVPSHCPVRASILLMTMSISVAPSATATRTSCRRVSRGVWPAGKPVATGRRGTRSHTFQCVLFTVPDIPAGVVETQVTHLRLRQGWSWPLEGI